MLSSVALLKKSGLFVDPLKEERDLFVAHAELRKEEREMIKSALSVRESKRIVKLLTGLVGLTGDLEHNARGAVI